MGCFGSMGFLSQPISSHLMCWVSVSCGGIPAQLGGPGLRGSSAGGHGSEEPAGMEAGRQARSPHSCGAVGNLLSAFGGSRSMIHQKVLWECTGVSGFLNDQLAIPGPGICQSSLSSPRISSSPLCCCSGRAGGLVLKAVFVVLL